MLKEVLLFQLKINELSVSLFLLIYILSLKNHQDKIVI